jgi:hypothetical protein
MNLNENIYTKTFLAVIGVEIGKRLRNWNFIMLCINPYKYGKLVCSVRKLRDVEMELVIPFYHSATISRYCRLMTSAESNAPSVFF